MTNATPNRAIAHFLFLAFLALAQPAHAQPVTRDWKAHPAVVELPMPADIYTLGDVHGDYDRMLPVLISAKIIAPNPRSPDAATWTAGPATLICTGDMIDKYNHALPVIALLRALTPQAEKAGGHVIITLGNHEAEFLASDGDDKKGAEFADELKAANLSPHDVAAGTDAPGIGLWLRNLPIAAKVGDWFFCHAGNTHGLTIQQLNDQIQSAVTAHGFNVPILLDPDSILEARMHPRPWWEWDGSPPTIQDAKPKKEKKSKATTTPDDPGEPRLRANLTALGANHLVFGHQPAKIDFPNGTVREAGQIFTEFNGLIYLIDTGLSRGANTGRGAVLHIHPSADPAKPAVSAIYTDGSAETLLP